MAAARAEAPHQEHQQHAHAHAHQQHSHQQSHQHQQDIQQQQQQQQGQRQHPHQHPHQLQHQLQHPHQHGHGAQGQSPSPSPGSSPHLSHPHPHPHPHPQPHPLHNGTAQSQDKRPPPEQSPSSPPSSSSSPESRGSRRRPRDQHHQQQQHQQQQQGEGGFGGPRGYGGKVAVAGGGPPHPVTGTQRFPSGQTISQPTGPTPTLNSLLQSGGTGVHHNQQQQQQPQQQPQQGTGYDNSVSAGSGGSVNYSGGSSGPSAPWAPPGVGVGVPVPVPGNIPPSGATGPGGPGGRPLPPYSPQPYRTPSPGGRTGSQPYPPAGGYPPPQGSIPPGLPPGVPAGYPPYNQQPRYPPPTGPAPGPPPGPNQGPGLRPPYSPHHYEQGSPQASPGGPPHSPGHAPSASPQPPHSPHTHQYPTRPGQPSTPNTHDPESELTGGNSNDSSSGGPPSRDGLVRPSPSPTGSSGSRSMSPAVGQQNIPMPPRPSSSSQDGAGGGGGGTAVRAPPQGGVPVGHGPPPPGGQPPPSIPYQHPPQPGHPYKMPTHHQPYPPPQHQYPQGNYPTRPPYPAQGYGPGATPGAGQYGAPGRPQGYPPYGAPGWGAPGSRAPPPPPHYLKQHLQHKAGAGAAHMGPPPPHHIMGPPGEPSQDNGLTGGQGPATQLVTTGPDGAPLDDGSQQSTLSNTSAASGDDGPCGTPRSGRGPGGAPSPGAASHVSAHDDYDASPTSWPRTPSSPVFNSHVPQESYRSKQKSDSLGKLYEMDESPERRSWVERLLSFMEERRTPIATCPTISKQPLDLYRLYLLVRDRGGFVEVTKNKTWKDIAGMLGIGASSSAAYTLRKHYTKNLLSFECHFDRGGIDPQPIINQIEASTKKKNNKNNSVPSPGSSNSQDSFPVGGNSSGSSAAPPMDGYGPPYSGYPPPPTSQQQGGASDNIAASNPFEDPQPRHGAPLAPSSHRNHQPAYPGQQGYGGYDQYGSPYPANRPVYPPYAPEQDNRGYPGSGNNVNSDPYGRYGSGVPPGGFAGARGYPPPAPGGVPPPAPPQSPTPPPNPSQDYYRPQGPAPPPAGPPPHLQQHEMASVNMNSQLARQLIAPLSPGGSKQSSYLHGYGANKNMPPPSSQPRRHPDFAKEQAAQAQYPPQRPQPPPHHQYGWGNNNSGGQYRGQFPNANNAGPPGTPWGGTPSRPPNTTGPGGSWGPQPYAQQMPPGVGVGGKREINFPPDSVEAVTPVTYKRRRVTKADIAPVEAWRIMMALKSGLLAETCWALDVLNILLFDDSSVGYFGLQHLPGLLDLLLEHFQKSLTDIFDPTGADVNLWHSKSDSKADSSISSKAADSKNSVTILKGENYTSESRKGKPVIYKAKDDDLFAPDDYKDWDIEEEHVEGIEPWQFGSDTSFVNHILPCFQSEFINIQFSRKIDTKKQIKTEAKSESECIAGADKNLGRSVKSENDKSNCLSEKKVNKRTKKLESDVISKKIKVESDVNGENKVNGVDESISNDEELKSKSEIEVRQNGPTDDTESLDIKNKDTAETEDNLKAEPMEIEKDEKPPEKKLNLKINDPAGILKRRHLSEYEDECYTRDEASLYLVTESQDSMARRCICLSNILRNLTFIPGNEVEFSKSSTFLALMGKLLLLHHEHPIRAPRTRNYDREEDSEWKSSCSSLQQQEWWWDFLSQLREDALVCCSNIGGQVDLGRHSEQVARPILDGLLHWAVCPSAGAQDPLPTVPPHRALSPRRLALEALCKLCVTDSNVDLVIATPPFPRLERLCSVLAKYLCRSEDQVLREFSVNLLHYLAAADSAMARTIAAQNPTVSLLVAFIEQAEQSALGVANQLGISALRDNPDSMGTSLDMLRRAAGTLLHLAKHPDNKPLFIQQEQRLLSLVMSQILDQKVAAELSKVLFQCSRNPRHPTRSD